MHPQDEELGLKQGDHLRTHLWKQSRVSFSAAPSLCTRASTQPSRRCLTTQVACPLTFGASSADTHMTTRALCFPPSSPPPASSCLSACQYGLGPTLPSQGVMPMLSGASTRPA